MLYCQIVVFSADRQTPVKSETTRQVTLTQKTVCTVLLKQTNVSLDKDNCEVDFGLRDGMALSHRGMGLDLSEVW